MPASSVLKASTGLFFLPFLVLILVGGITYPPLAAALGAKGARLASAALGVAGMILSHWLIRRAMAGKEGSSLRPTILRVVTDAPEGCGVVSPS
jgi:positive regulator of sigma E activity